MTKAISASIRGWMKRPGAMWAPLSNAMLRRSTPESGMSIDSAACIAFDVSPIFHPITGSPAAAFIRTHSVWMA